MVCRVKDLCKKGLLPGIAGDQKWIAENIQYECIMGSFAYGVSNDMSDIHTNLEISVSPNLFSMKIVDSDDDFIIT